MGPRGSAASGPGWQAAAAWLTLVVQAVIFGADTWQTRLPAQTLSVHLCILSAFRLVMVCSCLFDRYRIYVPRVCSSCVRSGAPLARAIGSSRRRQRRRRRWRKIHLRIEKFGAFDYCVGGLCGCPERRVGREVGQDHGQDAACGRSEDRENRCSRQRCGIYSTL